MRVHTFEYVERMRSFGTGELDPDTFLSEGSLEPLFTPPGRHGGGARCKNGDIDALSARRPPGIMPKRTRHGFLYFQQRGSGRTLRAGHRFERVFIIDFDAHHGNGTSTSLKKTTRYSTSAPTSTRTILKQKRHGARQGKGEGYTYNVQILRVRATRIISRCIRTSCPARGPVGPDIVIVSAGYDIHVNDPHANIRVSTKHPGRRPGNSAVLRLRPVVFVLEGGYDLPSLSDSVRISVEELLKE